MTFFYEIADDNALAMLISRLRKWSLMPKNVFSSMSHKMKSLTLCLDGWILKRMEKFGKKIGEKMRKGVVW